MMMMKMRQLRQKGFMMSKKRRRTILNPPPSPPWSLDQRLGEGGCTKVTRKRRRKRTALNSFL